LSYSSSDQKLLKRLYEQAQEIEQALRQGLSGWDLEAQISKLQLLLVECSFAKNTELHYLETLIDHLSPQMTAQHFANLIIPIERHVGRSVTDSDILITRVDRAQKSQQTSNDLIFCLDNLRSAFNVGSIFRLGDALNIKNIELIGYTPGPDHATVAKTALGSETSVLHLRREKFVDSITALRAQGFSLVALETSEQSTSLFAGPLPAHCAFIVGNERFGLEAEQLKLCDQVRSLPQLGIKNSLNVAQALAVAGYEWYRQHAH
jgi:23S rRNA (guanosine2251-2'-O)-methyltransferase